jgi:hypothetical protein
MPLDVQLTGLQMRRLSAQRRDHCYPPGVIDARVQVPLPVQTRLLHTLLQPMRTTVQVMITNDDKLLVMPTLLPSSGEERICRILNGPAKSASDCWSKVDPST